jgi:hypothetical protein
MLAKSLLLEMIIIITCNYDLLYLVVLVAESYYLAQPVG